MFDFTYQERHQRNLTLLFVMFFLGSFALAAINLLVPEASSPVAVAGDFEVLSLPTLGGLITSLGSLFLITRV